MDRWVFDTGKAPLGETMVASFSGCRLYDGDQKTSFKDGTLIITSHSIKFKNDSTSLMLPLRLVVLTSSVPGSWNHSPKIVFQLQNWESGSKPPGPFSSSQSNVAKVAMNKKGDETFCVEKIMKSLQNRVWERQTLSPIAGVSPDTMKILTPQNQLRTRGVGGAVRNQEQKHERETTLQSAGLQDLSNLMSHAKEMAVLARATSARLEQKSKDGSNMDEVARLRGIMLDLGVDTNVGNSKNNLESEIGVVSRSLLPKGGGMALLEEVFCALNRARGTELVSPDEIYHAAKHIETTLPSAGLKFKKYKSGICVLIDNSLTESAIIDKVEANY